MQLAKKHITVQYNERERSVDNLLSLIRRDAIENRGITDDDITEVNVYIKPEENAVYYVINNKVQGQIEF